MTIPVVIFTANGAVLPDETDILAAVLDDLNTAAGGNLNITNLNTFQGQIATSWTKNLGASNDGVGFLSNQFNPEIASGQWQDGIAKIYFLTRKAAQSTTVSCTCSGLSGTVIAAGKKAVDTNGNLYICTDGGTIPDGGSITLTFANVVTGPIPCPSGTLTQIYEVLNGWDSIINPTDGALGRDIETQQEFEARRYASVSLNSQGTAAAVYSAVFDIDEVTNVYVYENNTNAGVAPNAGYSVPAYNLYVAVDGGDNTEIATAIFNKNGAGTPTNGATTVSVTDEVTGQVYSIKFQRPTGVPIYFEVNIANIPNVPSNYEELVREAIVDQFATLTKIGGKLYAFNFTQAIMAISPYINIVSMFVGLAATPTDTYIEVDIDEIPSITSGNIDVNLVAV